MRDSGGQDVKEGYYLNVASWKFEHIAHGHGKLSGNGKEHYSRVPYPVVMMVGPLTGLAYVAFLPVMFCVGLGFCFLQRNGKKLVTRGSNSHSGEKN